MACQKYEISQGYLIATKGITVRIRKAIPLEGLGTKKYFFTLKVSTNGRCIEIENEIDKRDFYDLWDISLNKLEKIRYEVKSGKNTWECDFFKDYEGKTYIAIAELEMPEGQKEPEILPHFVKNNLLHKIEFTDNRFSNKLLGDARYAVKLLKKYTK